MKRKGAASMAAVVIALVVLAVGGVYVYDTISKGGAVWGGEELEAGKSEEVPMWTMEAGGKCDEDEELHLKILNVNPLDSVLYYNSLTNLLLPTNGGDFYDSNTTNSGGSGTGYTSLKGPCNPRTGEIVALCSAAVTGNKAMYDVPLISASDMITIDTPNSTPLYFVLHDSTFTNLSSPNTGATDATETTAVAVSAGDTRSGKLEVWATTGKMQFGGVGAEGFGTNNKAGIFWCWDSITAAAFSNDAFTLSSSDVKGFEEVDCDDSKFSEGTAHRSCNRCWVSEAIKASDGRLWMTWTLNNDGGTDAGSSDDVVLYVHDMSYFQDTDGLITFGSHNSAASAQCETDASVTWAIS